MIVKGMADFPQDVLDLLDCQDRAAARSQLLNRGITKETIRWNAGRSWRVVLPNVFVIGADNVTERQRHIAALLYAGSGSQITGAAAADFYGVRSARVGGGVEVVTSPRRRRRQAGFVTVRPSLLVDSQPTIKGPLAYVGVGRACVDAAINQRSSSAREAIFIEAVQKGLVSLTDLAEWIYRVRTRESAALHAAMGAAGSGAWSLPENRLLELMSRSSSLPAPWPNAKIEDSHGLPLLTPDVWFDDVGLAVMVHSRRHHSEAEQWDSTVARDAGLVSAGIVVVGVTPRQIDREPDSVLARVEAGHDAARRRPRPDVTAYEREGWTSATAS